MSDNLNSTNGTTPILFTLFSEEEYSNVTSNLTVPSSFREISDLSLNCVIIYSILFIISATGNVSVLFSVLKQIHQYKNRISLLILHLCVADLIVTFTTMPLEIVWRITIQWYGGDILCKLCQFFRAFGLYLSSMVVICISMDRYFAIIYPLKLARAAERAKITLILAWIAAASCAAPQAVVFRVISHPQYPTFEQCVTETFLRSDAEQELIYNVFSVSVLYFIPLLIIIFTYFRIVYKIFRKSRQHKKGDKMLVQQRQSISIGYHNQKKASVVTLGGDSCVKIDIEMPPLPPASPHPLGEEEGKRGKLFLRTSLNGGVLMARARIRTLRLTCVIVLTFVFCWTPYVVMTLWYMIDREGAKSLDSRVQEGLFLMAVLSSVANPLIYGTYSDCRRNSGNARRTTKKRPSPATNAPRKSITTVCGGVTRKLANNNTVTSVVLTSDKVLI